MKMTFTPLAALTLLCAIPLSAPSILLAGDGVDWPQWRGPDRTGVSVETGWSAAGKSLWNKPIGFGHSSFAVSGGRLFAMGYDLERKLDVVYCLDPLTGEEQWTHTYPADFWNEGHDGGTTTTPSVDGNTVYTSNREGKLFALRTDTGSVKWSSDLKSELDVTPPRWGFAGSPVVVGDSIIMNVDKVASIDKATGKIKWVTEKNYGNAYSTPIEYDFNGRPSMLVLNGMGLAVIDLADGSEITFYAWSRNPDQAVYGATPIVVDDRIFISAGSSGCVLLKPNDENVLELVWEKRVMRTSYAGCVLYKDHFYGFDASILKCIDLDGNEKWRQRGIGLGAMVVVGERLLIIGAKGELIIAEANSEKYVELSREKVLEGGSFWSTPILSNGLAYARNSLGDMVCQDYRTSGNTDTKTEVASIGDLPDAESLLARHVTASGGADALESMKSAYFTGKGERHGGGPIDHAEATLAWSADGAFAWRFSTGFEFGFNPELGWRQSQQGANVLEENDINNIREAGDLHRMLKPNWGYENLKTIDTRIFDDRQCYTVTATMPDGAERSLYFESESGLLAGMEGNDISLWVYNDYREIDGIMLPMSWSFFVTGSGSMTLATFSDVSLNSNDDDHYQPPTLIRMQTTSPEEKERANERLRAKYTDIVGNFTLASGSLAGTPIIIRIAEGGLQLGFDGQPPSYLTEPDEEGRLFDMVNNQIYVKIDRDAAGAISLMRIFAYGDELGNLDRVADKDD